MSHAESLAEVLKRTYYALSGRHLFSDGEDAAGIFEILLDHFGLTVVPTCGFVVTWNDGDPADIVQITDEGVFPPEFERPYTPGLARSLGTALIAAAHYAEVTTRGDE